MRNSMRKINIAKREKNEESFLKRNTKRKKRFKD